MLKIRRPLGRLIFNMGIAIPGKTVFLIETAPRWAPCWPHELCSPGWSPVDYFTKDKLYVFSLLLGFNKLLNKELNCQWFETPWCPCDVTIMKQYFYYLYIYYYLYTFQAESAFVVPWKFRKVYRTLGKPAQPSISTAVLNTNGIGNRIN